MTTDSKTWMEVIEKSYQFYAYVFTLYVISMGLVRWYGQTSWRSREEKRRKDAGLPVAECFSNAEQGFTYTSLFQGGLVGVFIAGAQMTWVLFMLAFITGLEPARTDTDVLWRLVSILMYFPVFMIAFFAVMILITSWSRIGSRAFTFAVCLIAACVAATIVADWKTTDKATLVLVQLFAVGVVSLYMSYLIGIASGLRRADPEANYPLVSVELHQGTGFDRVWLYERTDSDYRFLSATGTNYVIPAANVTKITKIHDQS